MPVMLFILPNSAHHSRLGNVGRTREGRIRPHFLPERTIETVCSLAIQTYPVEFPVC